MSRSRKKTPISGMAGGASNKEFKKKEHRRERRQVNVMLLKGKLVVPNRQKYGNEWASPRDGKMYFGNLKYDYYCYKYYKRGMRK